MIYQQGDIVEFDFNPALGHEPKNRRPAVVVSNFDFNSATSMTLVCPITRSNTSFFLHEPIPEEYAVEGAVVMEQLRAFDLEKRKAKKIDTLSEEDMRPILICLSSFFSPDGGIIEF